MASSSLRIAYLVLLSLPISALCCYSADVVFVRASEGSSAQQRNLEIATGFYGISLKVMTPSVDKDKLALVKAAGQNTTLAVIVDADALALVDQKELLRALDRRPGGSVPLLILGVTPETDATLLKSWSGGAATACRRLDVAGSPRYMVGRSDGFTRQLTDLELPLTNKPETYFELSESSSAQQVIKVRDNRGSFPVLIATTLGQAKIFLDCAAPYSNEAVSDWTAGNMVSAFAEIAPAIMFVRYSAGERGWHALHHYANLTIDDPWLREPYGNLNYKDLLAAMERHNFHSTIAFIPWNYDRSQPEVASLIREHPDRFSISIHGDDHAHKEFTDYRSKPLAQQDEAMKQSLARMERFQKLTGIPYDKVMVFPHSIAPENTLAALKTYNYVATVNSSNVPMDRISPSVLPAVLRPVTVSYADFPSIRRFPPDVAAQDGFLAMNAFLDNSIFFYCHEDFFANGMNAFNIVADQVNQLEPDTRWRGLGEIARHLYLVKLRDDQSYDVLAFSSNFILENAAGADSLFHVTKEEPGQPAITSVRVDGRSFPYQLHAGRLDFNILVPAGQARSVVVDYRNNLALASIGTSKNSVRVYLLRMASDFRDITISRLAPGRALIAFYNEHETKPMQVLVAGSGLLVFFICAGWLLGRTISRSRQLKRAA
jgi:hypothetical protein